MATGASQGPARSNQNFAPSPLVTSALLFILTVAAYLPLRRAGFISFDDPTYVTGNFQVQQGITWRGVKWAFTSFDGANWHPLTWLSHMLDVSLFGMSPGGHHFTSILLHALNVALLFLLLRLATKSSGRSLAAAAIFAVHPLSVESVAWIAERKNALSTFFWLVTFAAYGWYRAKPSLKRYLTVVLGFCAGLLAKPMLVTLPLTLLLLDLWPLRRFSKSTWRSLLLEKIPLFAISLASSVITVTAQQHEGAVNPAAFPLGLRMEQALISYCAYLGKIFAPTRLAVIYMHLRAAAPVWELAGAIALLTAISTLAAAARCRAPYLLAGWLWYLVTLVPVIGIVQVGSQGMADRYAYVPMIGILVAVVWLAADLFARLPQASRLLPAALSAATVLALFSLTLRQEGYWQDDETLLSHAIAVDPNNGGAYDELGMAEGQQGKTTLAEQRFRAALAINPRDQIAHMGLGYAYNARGDLADAEKEFRLALADTQSRSVEADAYSNLAGLAWKQGRADEAKQEYLLSVASFPRPRPYIDLGFLALDANDNENAVRYFEAANWLAPSSVAYYGLGRALHAEKRNDEALRALREALDLAPGYKQAADEISAIQKQPR